MYRMRRFLSCIAKLATRGKFNREIPSSASMNIGNNLEEEAEPPCCSQGQSGRTQRPRPPCLLFDRHSTNKISRVCGSRLGDKWTDMVLFTALNTPFLLWV